MRGGVFGVAKLNFLDKETGVLIMTELISIWADEDGPCVPMNAKGGGR